MLPPFHCFWIYLVIPEYIQDWGMGRSWKNLGRFLAPVDLNVHPYVSITLARPEQLCFDADILSI